MFCHLLIISMVSNEKSDGITSDFPPIHKVLFSTLSLVSVYYVSCCASFWIYAIWNALSFLNCSFVCLPNSKIFNQYLFEYFSTPSFFSPSLIQMTQCQIFVIVVPVVSEAVVFVFVLVYFLCCSN